MLMLRRRLRGHFVTVIQIVQSLSVGGVLCFCSPLRCICEAGGVNFLILSTGLKQQAAVRIQSGKTWYKSTKPLFVGRVRSKTCISSEISSCYSSPGPLSLPPKQLWIAGGSFLFHEDQHCAGWGGRMDQPHQKLCCFDKIFWNGTKSLSLFVQDWSLPRPFPQTFSRLPQIYQGFVQDVVKRFHNYFGRYVFSYICLNNKRTGRSIRKDVFSDGR